MTNILLAVLILISLVILVLLQTKKSGTKEREALNQLEASLKKSEILQEQLLKSIKDDFQRSREEGSVQSQQNREELSKSLSSFEQRLEKVRETIEQRLDKMRETIEQRLKDIQMDNNRHLEEMRQTVDEKLQETLNKRISDSFKLVSERLELVQKGLGEMSELATGVGDLKKVLQNVKTRGVLGEVQLGAILEQFLSPEQYEHNVKIKSGTSESVEYAVKLPGKDSSEKVVLLPIDSKFPVEDYQRLNEIYEKIDEYSREEIQQAEKEFSKVVKKAARQISDKYISPPKTTNFALMFVPTEGLYSQVLRNTGLFETLQNEYKITVVGPSNLVAFLNSLQMGFRTLAVQKRSTEVWDILSAVKKEFRNFEDVLKKAQQQLNQASNNLDTLVGTRTRAIQRKLQNVQELPHSQDIEVDNEGESQALGENDE